MSILKPHNQKQSLSPVGATMTSPVLDAITTTILGKGCEAVVRSLVNSHVLCFHWYILNFIKKKNYILHKNTVN